MIFNVEFPKMRNDDAAQQAAENWTYLFQLAEKLNATFNDIQAELDGIKKDIAEIKGENNGDL